MALTEKQADTLAFIKSHIKDRGFPPTLAEIAGFHGVTLTAAAHRVRLLEGKGAVTRGAHQARSIRPVKGYRVRKASVAV